jgi:hypothetical protein
MDGRGFDVGVSDPFLFVCKQKILDEEFASKRETFRTILIGKKVAVNQFHLL